MAEPLFLPAPLLSLAERTALGAVRRRCRGEVDLPLFTHAERARLRFVCHVVETGRMCDPFCDPAPTAAAALAWLRTPPAAPAPAPQSPPPTLARLAHTWKRPA